MADNVTTNLSTVAQGLLTDIEKVLGQRLGRLKEEVVAELGKATTAGGSVGGGLGMTALGTVLGGLAFAHLVRDVTGLPLWVCYAGSSAIACTTGAALIAQGVQKAGEMDLLPDGPQRTARPAMAVNGHGIY
jgi:hypothetical protein